VLGYQRQQILGNWKLYNENLRDAQPFEMRAALEAMTSSAIAPRITDEVLANLERLRAAMNDVSGDARKWSMTRC